MFLSTVQETITNTKNISVGKVARDLLLIWQNCRSYNAEDSEIYEFSNILESLTATLIQVINFAMLFFTDI